MKGIRRKMAIFPNNPFQFKETFSTYVKVSLINIYINVVNKN